MKEFIFTWSIENFSYSWHKPEEMIKSPKFLAGPMDNTSWHLQLYPRGSHNSDYIGLFLYREEDQIPIDLAVNFEFTCIPADNSELHYCFSPDTFTTFASGETSGYGEAHFIPRREVCGGRKALYLPNDILTLRCRMWKKSEDASEFQQMFGRTHFTIDKIHSSFFLNINPENETERSFFIQSMPGFKDLMSIKILYLDNNIDVRLNPDGKNVMFSNLKLYFVNERSKRKLCQLVISLYGDATEEKWRLPFSDEMQPTETDNSGGSSIELVYEFVYSTGEEKKTIMEYCPLKTSEFLSNYIFSCVPSGKLSDLPDVFEELMSLYHEEIVVDLTVQTPEITVSAHKTVLCARSPVFSAMLTDDRRAMADARIRIEGISQLAWTYFILFLYNDAFEAGLLEWREATELYHVAHTYEIERLKFLCCSYLLEHVNTENIDELTDLAARHNDNELKRKVDLIREHVDEVFLSPTRTINYARPPVIQPMILEYEARENDGPAETYEDKLSRVPRIREDIRSFIQTHIISDVVIQSKGIPYYANGTILCASSSVLKEMFKNHSRNEPLVLEDWDEEIVSRLLRFLRSDLLGDIHWDTAIKLYQAANVYQIDRLRIKCSCFFLENLSMSKAINLLLLAHEYNDVKLKSVLKDYICLHDEEIFGSDEWAALSEAHVQLANETMLAKYKKIK